MGLIKRKETFIYALEAGNLPKPDIRFDTFLSTSKCVKSHGNANRLLILVYVTLISVFRSFYEGLSTLLLKKTAIDGWNEYFYKSLNEANFMLKREIY